MPDQLELEAGFPEATRKKLKEMGNDIVPWPYTAEVEAVQQDAKGLFTAVFDPRSEGGAAAK